jgi:Iap family predicted aminopeptidase
MTQEEIGATDAMVNMDTLGLASTEVWASHSDKQLTNALAYLGKLMNQPVRGVNVEQIGSTDSEQFAARKIPSITIHSLTQETWNARILHTRRDKISEMQLDEYYASYRLIAAYLVYLDQLLPVSTEKAQ